jgi:pilus assembly protein CpaC
MKARIVEISVLAGLAICASALRAQVAPATGKILIGTGKTYVLDSAVDIERISVASPEVAESVPVSSRTVIINGKTPGETTAILWLSDGTRKEYDVTVMFAATRLDAAKLQIDKEFGGSVQLTGDASAVYLTGTVKNIYASDRAQSIAGTIGKVVNLLNVQLQPQEQQILLKVKFIDVDRSKSLALGANILGTPGGYPVNVTTGAASPSRFTTVGNTGAPAFNLSDALNVLLFDPHLNVGTTIQALEGTNVLQILAEPNLLAMNGHLATFVAGGEFPYPTLQGGGGGVGQVTVSFREFGIKLKFTPTITPRGTIRLHIAPEVSSLDFADSLTIEGGSVPALTTRKVETEVELEDGQSFAIAGMLDRQTTETLSKIPGLSNIPILGKFLFTSKTTNRSNSELMVIVTPELVAPMAKEEPLPVIERPMTWLEGPGIMTTPPRTPGTDQTGPVPARPVRSEIPVQEMEKIQREDEAEKSSGQSSSSGSGYGSGSGSGTGGGSGSASPAATITLPMQSPPVTNPITINPNQQQVPPQ